MPASRRLGGRPPVPDIHIQREHSLGLPEARKLAFRWAELAQEKFEMACSYEEGKSSDLVTFNRSGVNGELKVTADAFELDARLGFLLGVFKDRIETEITKNLDQLLTQDEPLKAFEEAVVKATETSAAKKAAPRKKKA
jgi:putative polyhydroxyalkanoate system protein